MPVSVPLPAAAAMKVWRITRQRHAANAFSGEGARLVSGRWNPAGLAMVYTSSSLSLAAIETFVHLSPNEQPNDLVSIEASLPVEEAQCERVPPEQLRPDWRRLNNPALQTLGEQWLRSRRTLALLVPSAVIDGEWNVLLNPAHPQASAITVLTPKAFRFDARMFKRGS